MLINEIHVRDPFVVVSKNEQKYYLFGSNHLDESKAVGFDTYISNDLVHWEGPFPVFRPDRDFWSEENFWASEVHEYNGDYYMLATFCRRKGYKGTAILKSKSLKGPFIPYSDGPVTPECWECLDGTLYVDPSGCPWMVFCHEWVQVADGEICAIQLSKDLRHAIGEPYVLFKASQAPWTISHDTLKNGKKAYVTDGPFLYRLSNNHILMLWSSFAQGRAYAVGTAVSLSGDIRGPWVQNSQPLYSADGGHAMLFKDFDNRLMLSLHRPNRYPSERPAFVEVTEEEDSIFLKD